MLVAKKPKISLTLIELVVVVVIVGILATLSFSQYYSAVEKSMAREAVTALRLIRAAEEIYYSQLAIFYGVDVGAGNFTGTGTGNTALRLTLNERNWNYDIPVANVNAFTAQAARTGGPFAPVGNICTYTINQNGVLANTGRCPIPAAAMQ